MPILFIGESGDIENTLTSRLRSEVGADLISTTFEQFSLDRIPPQDFRLIVVGVEDNRRAEAVGRILADESVQNRIPVVVIARQPSGDQVLEWLRLGSSAVELWPCQPSRIAFLVDYLTVGRRSKPAPQPDLNVAPKTRAANDQIITASATMQRLTEQIKRVASLDANVLFTGETGVGKTRLARLLHDSSRSHEPFFAVNCGALPENLLESELFGHRRGAFTGADADRKGRFEEVGHGTLFLDEVDSIPINSQCKLLRAIENRLFEPIGSNRPIKFRGRIVAASNSQLDRLIAEGRFRADLYYRLGVVDLYIPPLRERREDIQPIAEAALKAYTKRNKLPVRSISHEVIERLNSYSWPGNIRQLKNVIESSASLCRGDQIELSDLCGRWLKEARELDNANAHRASSYMPHASEAVDAHQAAQSQQSSLAESRAILEADRIISVLREVGYNRTKAAIMLGISRTMLYKKLDKYGLADAR